MTFSKLGTDVDTGQIVELSQASRRQGLYIIGANGTGKTGLIEHLILQDIDQGLGVGLLDPHGDLVNAILAKMTKREDDVILLDIQDEDHPFGLNLFACPNPQSNTAVQKIVDLVMHIFEKLYDVNRAGTPLLLDYLRNCTYTLVANPGYTMADIPLLFTDQNCRQKLLANISEPYVKLFWQQYEQLPLREQRDEAASTMRRVREFLQPLSRNIVGQAQTTVNMQHIMDERKILLVKLSAQLDQVTSLVGTMFIALFLNAAYTRASIPVNKRKQFNLYADEFQRFATEDFATLLTEARKFGIATTIAHQARFQPGMTDGIRAVSLQAANQVVFRVTSPDADELAGGFDISPQAAWEEEIAKEWVEVLTDEWDEEIEPEWFERVEEDVIDGDEEIKTPVKDVVGHLLRAGNHPHPVVNDFANGWLRHIQAGADLNLLLYNAMTKKPLPSHYSTLAFHYIFYWGHSSSVAKGDRGFSHILSCLDGGHFAGSSVTWGYDTKPATHALIQYFQTDTALYLDQFYEHVKAYIRNEAIGMAVNILHSLRSSPNVPKDNKWVDKLLPPPTTIPDSDLKYLQDNINKEKQKIMSAYYPHSYFHIDVYQLEWEIGQSEELIYNAYINKSIPMTVDVWIAKKGQEDTCIDYHVVDQLAEEIFEQEVPIFEERLFELKAVMQALADDPIEVGSGLARPRKRTQINYHTHPRKTQPHPRQTLTHPRKVIMHPQRTYQDVKNDIANQLSGFPNFTARVKLSEILSHNPGKKCLHCGYQSKSGNKFCAKCGKKLPVSNEYTVMTLKPLGGLGQAALQQRLTTIQSNNIHKGYVRDRTKVEDEIIKRQQSCSGAAPAQPQKLQQQVQHARNVPVQGKCPNCGAVNSSSAKFCNQCGTKL